MKQILFIALFAMAINGAKAQDTTYFDNTGRAVKSLQMADYYRIVKPDADDMKMATSLEYYKSGKLKSKSSLKNTGYQKANWVIDGKYKSWYENGKRQSTIGYSYGSKNGKLIAYWPNGKQKREECYEFSKFISGNCYNEKGDKIDYFPYSRSAQFIGGGDSLYSYFRRNIQQIPADSGKVLTGMVLLNFSVNADGAVSDVAIKKSSDTRLNQEAIRVISSMPKWMPALRDGELEIASVSQMVQFGRNERGEAKVPNVIEQMPQFEGGESAMMNFISRNIHYPVKAMEQCIQGKVIVRFVVNETGEVTQVSVLRGIGGGCDEEAMRVVSMMPRWKPGKQDGRPVSVWYTLPIGFKFLENNVTNPFNSNQNRNFRTF